MIPDYHTFGLGINFECSPCFGLIKSERSCMATMWPLNARTKACVSILSNTGVTHSVLNAYIIMNVMGTKWDMPRLLRKAVSSDRVA